MLNAYTLTIDIIAKDEAISETDFRDLVTPSLKHLDDLKGAFDKEKATKTFFEPGRNTEKLPFWIARAVVMISIGKERATHLMSLFDAIAKLIEMELPNCSVNYRKDAYTVNT